MSLLPMCSSTTLSKFKYWLWFCNICASDFFLFVALIRYFHLLWGAYLDQHKILAMTICKQMDKINGCVFPTALT